jgi:hypothetical protein
MIMQFYKFSALLLATFPLFSDALESSCVVESLMLLNNSALLEAANNKWMFMHKKCVSTEVNDVCSGSNTTIGPYAHWMYTVDFTGNNAIEVLSSFETSCEDAGGKVALVSFDIGFETKGNSQYQYLDYSVTGNPSCLGNHCDNATVVGDFIQYAWASALNRTVYNFTLND